MSIQATTAGRAAGLGTTDVLLTGARAGDAASREALARRFLPHLRRMAFARWPRGGLGSSDAEDLVQETLLRAFQHLEDFVPRCDGAFLIYLRRILVNLVRDLARREKRVPPPDALEVDPPGGAPTPVEEAVGRETWERYRKAVERLSERQEQAVVLFVECGMEFAEIAEAIGSPSVPAARMVVARGLERLAELMHEGR
jgi:RNA polymerase sigma-70 factor (ECF subfamily)